MSGQRLAILRDAHRLDAALDVATELLKATRGNKALVVEHASACVEAGNLCLAGGDFDQALGHYQQGLKVSERQDEPRQRARLLGNLGELERRRGNLAAAERQMRAQPWSRTMDIRAKTTTRLPSGGGFATRPILPPYASSPTT